MNELLQIINALGSDAAIVSLIKKEYGSKYSTETERANGCMRLISQPVSASLHHEPHSYEVALLTAEVKAAFWEFFDKHIIDPKAKTPPFLGIRMSKGLILALREDAGKSILIYQIWIFY